MYTLFGTALILLSSAGLAWTIIIGQVPLPWWAFVILPALALTGCLTFQRNSIIYATALSLVINWSVVHFGYAFVYESVSFIAENPLFSFDPGPFVAGIFITFGAISLVGLVVYYRAVRNMTDMNQSENDDTGGNFLIIWIKKLFGLKQDEFKHLDTVLCKDTQTNKEVVLKGRDRMVSLAIVGTTGTGKTVSIMVPLIRQDIERLARGHEIAVQAMKTERRKLKKKLLNHCIYRNYNLWH